MQIDPALEWQRLAEEYRRRTPEELLELARDFNDLTETARQALRSEMHNRGLSDPESPGRGSAPVSFSSQSQGSVELQQPGVLSRQTAGISGFGSEIPQLIPDDPEARNADDSPHEYTWKTPLCECYNREEAAQLQEVLRRAGIESWFNFGGYTSSVIPTTSHSAMSGDIQILVAADQLEQAQAVAAQPIPREIVDESNVEIPEFVEPKCPKCGSDDVVLEGVDPANAWRCEQCDAQWTETMPTTDGPIPNRAKSGS